MRERVAALLALAQHPNTPLAEAETALAMASKLMQKHGITDGDLAGTVEPSDDVIVESVRVCGKYRVRRQNLLYAIALVHSCAGYRSDDEGDCCVVVLYGRANDILAARTLFAAADAMGARLLPRGDRSSRVSWWKGFQWGIEEALRAARNENIEETPGAGLVLSDRMRRAERELRSKGPPLRTTYSTIDPSSSAYSDGVSAGRGFSVGGRSFGSGVRGELS